MTISNDQSFQIRVLSCLCTQLWRGKGGWPPVPMSSIFV